jgi:hypothetical protein
METAEGRHTSGSLTTPERDKAINGRTADRARRPYALVDILDDHEFTTGRAATAGFARPSRVVPMLVPESLRCLGEHGPRLLGAIWVIIHIQISTKKPEKRGLVRVVYTRGVTPLRSLVPLCSTIDQTTHDCKLTAFLCELKGRLIQVVRRLDIRPAIQE